MTGDDYCDLAGRLRGELRRDEPLARHISLKVGGPADLFAVPADLDDLLLLVRWLDERGIPRLVVGGGCNLLVRDGGYRGVVISLASLNRLERRGEGMLRAEAGATTGCLTGFSRDQGLAGLEFLATIPGTVGGAARMNAGCYGSEFFDQVVSLEVIRNGELAEMPRGECHFGYRYLDLAESTVIAAVTFALSPAPPAAVASRMAELRALRGASQTIGYPSAGSWFKNPQREAAWRLIDVAGLRGAAVGGAQISEVHSNFLVNRGNATARNFLDLAALIMTRVKEVTGVELEEEVRIVGEENGNEGPGIRDWENHDP